jgi:hypothetical protein
MRRTHPECVTFILTGYPGFESALQAIRSQVDNYLIKPANPRELVAAIEESLRASATRRPAPNKRIAAVLRDNVFEITRRTLASLKDDPEIATIPLTDTERIDHIPEVIRQLAGTLECLDPAQAAPQASKYGALTGEIRKRQGYRAPLLIKDLGHLQRAIYDVIHENLLSLDLSYLMLDLKRVNESLATHFEMAVRSYGQAEHVA